MEAIRVLLQYLTRMQWSDYLDIIVVAFLIYKLLPMIRTPSIMRIARTVLAIVVISWITDAMKLHTINFILNSKAVETMTRIIKFYANITAFQKCSA